MSNDEILREFLLETHENLALLDADLLTLEKNPTEKSTLAQVFRTLHSVKGTAGFMGLVKLQSVAHASESLLSRLRAGEMCFNPEVATVLLQVVDAIREILSRIETSGEEGTGDYSALVAEVDRLREAGNGKIPPPPAVPPVTAVDDPSPPPSPVPTESPLTAEFLSAPLAPKVAAPDRVAEPPAETATHEPAEARAPSMADTSIRVDVGLLDKLMTLMGELVLARNQILQYSTLHEDGGFVDTVQRLNRLTTELQASVMKTRMQPIGNVLNKFPRIVRDLALACGKKVRFEMDGQDTELDKTLLEAIRDPLTHMVRNAIDHGIETPEVRKSRGKPDEGRLRMIAYHEGGKVIVEITDDGTGIDVARVREKALSARIVPADEIGRMSQQDLVRLVFLPGFSTADRVTQFSGRGVGMDVVRTNIEKIGGTVDIESDAGLGTRIRTKIPLTLAIIPALIIVSGGERYALPQVSLLELVRLDAEQAQPGIEWLHGVPVYRLRGTLLPLVFLNEQLRLKPSSHATDSVNIVVLQADDRSFGLVVDAIRDTEEIVVKPLQKQLKGIPVFAGAAIMGDGRVALVLDVLGLAQKANVISGSKSRSLADRESSSSQAPSESEQLLLFSANTGNQMAIPLSQVARLEEFPRSCLENLGAGLVVQYRGEILSLIDVSERLAQLQPGAWNGPRTSVPNRNPTETVPVVVCFANGRRVGLSVGRILDIVHHPVANRSSANRAGVLFTAIVQERVTEVIDLTALTRESLIGGAA